MFGKAIHQKALVWSEDLSVHCSERGGDGVFSRSPSGGKSIRVGEQTKYPLSERSEKREAGKIVMDDTSHLILHRTPRERVKEGITVITGGEGVPVFDQDGKSYLDLVAGLTCPIHMGYGRKEVAQAAYEQMCQLPYFTPCYFPTCPR